MAKEFKEKTITINLSRVFSKPATKRVIGAKHLICEGVKKETRLKEFKLSNKLNELLWARGKYSAQRKITVKIVAEKNTARIMLPEEKYEAKTEAKKTAPKTEAVPAAEAKEKPKAEEKAKEKKTAVKKE